MGVPRATKGEAAFGNLRSSCTCEASEHRRQGHGSGGLCLDDYPFRSIHPHLRRVYDAFGPQRMFWGTDITRMPCSWKQCVTLFTEELPWLTGRDLELVMGRAFCDWIGWKLPGN